VKKRWFRVFAGRKGNGDQPDPTVEGLAASDDDQTRAETDQTLADADQTLSDADQGGSDAEQQLADDEQRQADADQESSDRDQAAADRELAAHPGDPDIAGVHEDARAEREAGTVVRGAGTVGRFRLAEDRARSGATRDETARARDLTARARDAAAAARDQAAMEAESSLATRGSAFRKALKRSREIRAQAAEDRARAAADRELAARDREDAARDRAELIEQLRLAHVDELTGALRRGMGEVALNHEIERARRGNGKLVLAYIDVNGLKAINDEFGHAAGDVLLQNLVKAVRSRMRSYEPIVRYGGDEFVCSIAEIDLDAAERRFREIDKTFSNGDEGGSFSVGLAELRDTDTLADLVGRADIALTKARLR
jgi:diguanylate cyclase (GGDEF)-like protein